MAQLSLLDFSTQRFRRDLRPCLVSCHALEVEGIGCFGNRRSAAISADETPCPSTMRLRSAPGDIETASPTSIYSNNLLGRLKCLCAMALAQPRRDRFRCFDHITEIEFTLLESGVGTAIMITSASATRSKYDVATKRPSLTVRSMEVVGICLMRLAPRLI